MAPPLLNLAIARLGSTSTRWAVFKDLYRTLNQVGLTFAAAPV